MKKSRTWSVLCKIAVDQDFLETRLEQYIHQINTSTPRGSTALHFAVLGNTQTVQWLLKSISKEYLSEANDNGETPLHWAAKEGSLDMVISLLDHGANKNQKDYDDKIPLDWAVEYEREDLIPLLATDKNPHNHKL